MYNNVQELIDELIDTDIMMTEDQRIWMEELDAHIFCCVICRWWCLQSENNEETCNDCHEV